MDSIEIEQNWGLLLFVILEILKAMDRPIVQSGLTYPIHPSNCFHSDFPQWTVYLCQQCRHHHNCTPLLGMVKLENDEHYHHHNHQHHHHHLRTSSNSLWVMSAPPPPPQAALQVARHKWPTLRPTIRYRALSNSVFLCCVFLCISLSLSGTDPRLGKLLEIAARALRPLRRALIHL